MKKVIFVGGTSYSGSTFLDMILANSPHGFSCGEVYALFWPYRKHHIDYECGCGDPDCEIWETVKSTGATNLYQRIFEIFPDLDFIVDSSKDPLWISDRIKDLTGSRIQVKNILIWKSPEEFYSSRMKRNQKRGWKRSWINYHKLYFRMVKHWFSIPYHDLASNPDSLKMVCEKLEIPFFDGKDKYWEKVHHTLFGNTSAKIHLYGKTSKQFKTCSVELRSNISQLDNSKCQQIPHQEIYYEPPKYDEKEKHSISIHPEIQCILKILLATDISSTLEQDSPVSVEQMLNEIKASKLFELYHRIKRPIITSRMNICGKLR
jgi:hypothetical protein